MCRFRIAVLLASVFATNTMAFDSGQQGGAPTVYDWSGMYLGVDAGYVHANGDWEFDPNYALGTSAPSLGGPVVGLHAGAQYQLENNIVLGIEADIQRLFASDSAEIESAGVIIPITLDTTLNWAGSARVRAGYALSRWMPYLTGGLAIGSFDVIGSTVPFLVSAPNSDLGIGWTLGAGIEHALMDNLLVRTEYRYSDYGSVDRSALGLPDTFRLNTHQFSVGVSYKF